MDLGIAGKWALVGGASKGLGWGCARALALEGVNVVMVARGAEVLQASVARLQQEAGARQLQNKSLHAALRPPMPCSQPRRRRKNRADSGNVTEYLDAGADRDKPLKLSEPGR